MTLLSWGEVGAWLPAGAVFAVAALAGLQAVCLPAPVRDKLPWVVGVILCGVLATGGVVWQQLAARAALSAQGKVLRTVSLRLAGLNQKLFPGKDPSPTAIFDAVEAALDNQQKEIAELKQQAVATKKRYQQRAIAPAVAAAMAEFLRQQGSERIVVSCARDNVEAYDYANQLATIVRSAGWQAAGPEPTAIFGTAKDMAIALYIRGPKIPAAAEVLLKAFAKFNIPYQSRLAPTNAIPDDKTVELFVPAKP